MKKHKRTWHYLLNSPSPQLFFIAWSKCLDIHELIRSKVVIPIATGTGMFLIKRYDIMESTSNINIISHHNI